MPSFEKGGTAARHSHFVPSEKAMKVLHDGRILGEHESPAHMNERVTRTLTDIEEKFGTSRKEIDMLADEFGALMDDEYCLMSTPVLTNAGRHLDKPLSACTVPALDLAHDSIAHIKESVTRMHQEGMGTGFNLSDLADPVSTLKQLNYIAVESAASGKEDRPVGNMAILSVYHPKILDFIHAKVLADGAGEIWKFNISVDCDEAFFFELEMGGEISLQDGTRMKARELLEAISQAAHACADPGLIFLDRMEKENPTPAVGHYVSTAPCGEVGLAPGESCQFGYLNLARFVTEETGDIDIEKLKSATCVLTRILDNALEISIENYSEEANKHVMSQKRKIGVGICGLADLFIKKGLRYDSEEARQLALDLVALINFESKLTSHELAKTRGSFKAMDLAEGNRHLATPSIMEKKYGHLSTAYVSETDWKELADTIRTTKLLRNASTTAVPPTGRSALVIDASTGIEPIFSLEEYLEAHPHLREMSPDVMRTAKDITPSAHLLMAAFIQRGVDESISKTINLPAETTAEGVGEMYLEAWKLGLKGISVYREGSKHFQPRRLS